MSAPPVPEGGAHPVDYRFAVVAQPRFSKMFNPQGQVVDTGACPVCKTLFNIPWKDLKEHIQKCRRQRQYPLLMRTCYCPYCIKKCSDHYALSAHIHAHHSSHISQLKNKHKNGINSENCGISNTKLHETFPFKCTACNFSWLSARGIAEHFTKNEQKGLSCGGNVEVKLVPVSRDAPKRVNDMISYRHDFIVPLVCPLCTDVFAEAYEMSDHIAMKHMVMLKSLEKKLAEKVQEFPKKKLYYEPFMCATCSSTFQSMDKFADHIDERIKNRIPCLGDVKVVKYVKRDGKGMFQSNVPAPLKNTPQDAIDIEDDADLAPDLTRDRIMLPSLPMAGHHFAPADVPSDPTPGTSQAVVKDEPLDEGYEFPPADEPVIKEEPIDEEEILQEVNDSEDIKKMKEEKKEEEDEEEEILDCEECNITFGTEREFIEHMKGHGYELANPEQLEKIESGECDGTPSKKSRAEDHGTSGSGSSPGSGPGSRPKYPALPGNDEEYCCQSCDFVTLYMHELTAHMRDYHCIGGILAQPHLCVICKRRRFETLEKLHNHEKGCRTVKRLENRDKSFSEPIFCPFCTKRQPNAFVFSTHLMNEHQDLIARFRFHRLIAPELLPFRCNACNIGFEDARFLLDHFRLREEFGKGCGGVLKVQNYQDSLRILLKNKKEPPVHIPTIPALAPGEYDVYNDKNSDEFVPNDPPPPLKCDVNHLNKCPSCTEMWPAEQMKWHIKMEHPKYYFDYGQYRCKLCKHYSFYCPMQYELHYMKCSATHIMKSDDTLLNVASKTGTGDVPSMHRGPGGRQLRAIPENIGNEMRPCRFCRQVFSPPGLLCHQKMEHPIEHYADAPYQCGRCDEVGFYCHKEFLNHSKKCTGTAPDQLQKNIYAITAKEVEMRTGVRRMEVPSYRAAVSEDRRKFGTLAAFNRPHSCPLCKTWCTSLETMDEHFKDAHNRMTDRMTPFLCGGCGIVFNDAKDLQKHLKNQEMVGNVQCFDMATTFSSVTNSINRTPIIIEMGGSRNIAPPPLVITRPAIIHRTIGISPVVANWKQELKMDPAPPTDGFVSLSRQQAARKRQLLPIRHISALTKSPLSGERNFAVQQLIERNKATSYYKQVSVHERQRKFLTVDPCTPLSLPSTSSTPSSSFHPRSSVINSIPTMFDPHEPLRNEPRRVMVVARPGGETAMRPQVIDFIC